MAIKKLKNGRWELDIRDFNGKRIRKKFDKKIEAELLETEIKSNKNKGLCSVIDKSITIKDACEYFLEKHVKIHCKQKTYDEGKIIVNSKIIPYFGNMKLCNLTKVHVENFMEYLLKLNLSNSTVNKYKNTLSSIIERQVENGTIFQNVVKKVKSLKVYKANKARALTEDEYNKLLDTCLQVKPEFYPMLYTILNTGMRRGEIIALRWENVDFIKNKIYVRESEYKAQQGTPKSESSIRDIDMHADVRKILLEQKLKSGNSKFVFPNSKGGMFMGNNVTRRYFAPVLKASNIGYLRLHDTRHTYGSILLENNTPIKYVQEQMGHSSCKVTLDIYNHSSEKSKEIANEIFTNVRKVS